MHLVLGDLLEDKTNNNVNNNNYQRHGHDYHGLFDFGYRPVSAVVILVVDVYVSELDVLVPRRVYVELGRTVAAH